MRRSILNRTDSKRKSKGHPSTWQTLWSLILHLQPARRSARFSVDQAGRDRSCLGPGWGMAAAWWYRNTLKSSTKPKKTTIRNMGFQQTILLTILIAEASQSEASHNPVRHDRFRTSSDQFSIWAARSKSFAVRPPASCVTRPGGPGCSGCRYPDGGL